jgi:hypothetical protein
VTLQIGGIPSGRRLEFSNPQPPVNYLDASDFVFFEIDATDLEVVGPDVFDTGPPNDTFSLGVLTISRDEVLVPLFDPLGPNRLIARLKVTADTASPPMQFDAFTINVLHDSTFFANATDDDIPFTSIPGIVTTGLAVAAVPEPSSSTMLVLGGAALVAGRYRQFRRRS